MLLFALLSNVLLQCSYLLSGNFHSLSKGEISALSGISKSDAGCIIHAGGSGGRLFCTGRVELQPAFTNSNIITKLIDSGFSIGQFLCVFLIKCRYIALPRLHVGDNGFLLPGQFLGMLCNCSPSDGLIIIVVSSPAERQDGSYEDFSQPAFSHRFCTSYELAK